MNIVDIIKNFIKKQFNKTPLLEEGKNDEYATRTEKIDEYAQNAEKIDDISLIEQFYKKCSSELKKEIEKTAGDVYNSEMQTKISDEQLIRLTKEFFKSIDVDYSNKIDKILDNKNPEFKLNISDSPDIENMVSNPNQHPIKVDVRKYGDLRDVYGLVHELTHTLDIDKGDNPTRQIFGEIAPQCMERLLDKFLIENANSEELDMDILLEDIENRKYTTFLSRMKNVQYFNKEEERKKREDIPKRKNSRPNYRC